MSASGDGASGLAQVPPGVTGVLVMGHEAVNRGAYGDAVRWFETAISLQPRLAVAHTCLGLALVGLAQEEAAGGAGGPRAAASRLAEAVEAFGHAADLDPANPMPRYHEARTLAAMGAHRRAMARLAPLAARFPKVREEARGDAAFDTLGDHPWFLQIVGTLPDY